MSDELVIEPGKHAKQYWHDIWRYRELFQILAWRDIAVRYKQTVFGVLWALVRPVSTLVVFVVIFGKVAKLPSDGESPYVLLVLAGMLPWTFFSTAISDASSSLIQNANLISKVYFPRLIVPAATLAVALVDFLVGMSVMVCLYAWLGYLPPLKIFLLPFFVLLALFVSMGPSFWLASLNVRFRDFRYIVPFITQFGLYVSPVGYSSTVFDGEFRLLLTLNPIVGVIDGFRWCLLHESPFRLDSFIVTLFVSAGLLAIGTSRFRRMEKQFADII
jgi:lipopolysaccharide transport system permease protein